MSISGSWHGLLCSCCFLVEIWRDGKHTGRHRDNPPWDPEGKEQFQEHTTGKESSHGLSLLLQLPWGSTLGCMILDSFSHSPYISILRNQETGKSRYEWSISSEDPPSPAAVTHPTDLGPMEVRESGGGSEEQELNVKSVNEMALEQAWTLKKQIALMTFLIL